MIALVITVSFVLHLVLFSICKSYYDAAEREMKKAEDLLNKALATDSRTRDYLKEFKRQSN